MSKARLLDELGETVDDVERGWGEAPLSAAEAVQALATTASGRHLLARDFKLVLDPQAAAAALYRPGRVIALPPSQPAAALIFQLACGLRRLAQPDLRPLDHEPDEAVLLHRALTFDAACFGIRVAYEMLRSGRAGLWRHLQRHPLYAPPARRYEQAAVKDFRALNDGRAHLQAFNQCFQGTQQVDRWAIHLMLMDDYLGSPLRTPVDRQRLAELGQLPSGASYLAGRVEALLQNGSTIVCRHNANFLWFIKFERSFLRCVAEPKPPAGQVIQWRPREKIEA